MVLVPSWSNSVTISKKLTAEERKNITLYFNNLVLYNLIKLNYTDFIAKAKGGSDRFGEQWMPLAAKTIKWKRKKKLLYGGKVAINIRTRALMHALKPNKFSQGQYVPGPNQTVRVTTKGIYFEVDIEYADAVNAVREIIPADLSELLVEAVQRSLPQFQKYLRSLKL